MSSFCLLLRFKWLPWQPPQYPRLPPNIFWYPWVSLTYLAWWHNSSRKLSLEQVFDTLMPDYKRFFLFGYTYLFTVYLSVPELPASTVIQNIIQTKIYFSDKENGRHVASLISLPLVFGNT